MLKALITRSLAAVSLVLGVAIASQPQMYAPFVVKPYLNLGTEPATAGKTSVTLLWHTEDPNSSWSVKYRCGKGPEVYGTRPEFRRVDVKGLPRYWIVDSKLDKVEPNQLLLYTVLRNGSPVFTSTARGTRGPGSPLRFVAIGDVGRNTPGQRAVAFGIQAEHPDLVLVTGDIVYPNGRMSEYRSNFFSIANADQREVSKGAPLMHQIPFVGVTGNHDTAYRSLTKFPDGLAYYPFWRQPLNGPAMPIPVMGSAKAVAALSKTSGGALERGGNFSFDEGDVHFTVLDSNTYADWRRPDLRAWLQADLKRAQSSRWRIVTFHHPPYHSSKKHAGDTMMRVVTPLFTQYEVDLVLCGHVHNYQRSFPLRATNGQLRIDRRFDGKNVTNPDGTIYIVTGAGGAELYDQKMAADRRTWKDFTANYLTGYSYTLIDVSAGQLTLKQVGESRKVLDQITVRK